MQQGTAIKLKTCNEMGGAQAALAASSKLQQNANEGCNSCASLAELQTSYMFYCSCGRGFYQHIDILM